MNVNTRHSTTTPNRSGPSEVALSEVALSEVALSEVVAGHPLQIGDGFEALSFRQADFLGLMDPLIMVDHFTMTTPTFGAHPHAGMSAVSLLFEDSEGLFQNRDSLGNTLDLHAGDLYWLKAGRGAVHDEAPLPGSRTHALQVFVNLPARLKFAAPSSLHVRAQEMPILEGTGYRARLVLGQANGVVGAQSPALPITIVDATLQAGGAYTHQVGADRDVWISAIAGELQVSTGHQRATLPTGSAVALRTGGRSTQVAVTSAHSAHLVLFEGEPLREPFVQHGPFVMSTAQDVQRVRLAHARGLLGTIHKTTDPRTPGRVTRRKST